MNNVQLLVSIGLFAVMFTGIANAQCYARTAPQRLTTCLQKLNTLTSFQKGPVSPSALEDYCRSDAESEIKCAEDFINECRQSNDDVRRILDRTVNINAVRGAVKIVCNNTKAFVKNQQCIGRFESGVTSCILGEYNSFQLRLRSARGSEERVYEELCDYVGEVKDCQRPYSHCGKDIADIFDALAEAATPPVCSGVTENVNLFLLVSLAVLSIIRRF